MKGRIMNWKHIKRFSPCDESRGFPVYRGMGCVENGKYVLFEDYEKLRKEADRLTKENKTLKKNDNEVKKSLNKKAKKDNYYIGVLAVDHYMRTGKLIKKG